MVAKVTRDSTMMSRALEELSRERRATKPTIGASMPTKGAQFDMTWQFDWANHWAGLATNGVTKLLD